MELWPLFFKEEISNICCSSFRHHDQFFRNIFIRRNCFNCHWICAGLQVGKPKHSLVNIALYRVPPWYSNHFKAGICRINHPFYSPWTRIGKRKCLQYKKCYCQSNQNVFHNLIFLKWVIFQRSRYLKTNNYNATGKNKIYVLLTGSHFKDNWIIFWKVYLFPAKNWLVRCLFIFHTR